MDSTMEETEAEMQHEYMTQAEMEAGESEMCLWFVYKKLSIRVLWYKDMQFVAIDDKSTKVTIG